MFSKIEIFAIYKEKYIILPYIYYIKTLNLCTSKFLNISGSANVVSPSDAFKINFVKIR